MAPQARGVKFLTTIREPMATLLSVFSFGKARKTEEENLLLLDFARSRKWTEEYHPGCIRTLFDHYATCWLARPASNFLLLPYEDLVAEPVRWIPIIARFMGLPDLSPGVTDLIVTLTSRSAMLANVAKFDGRRT